VTRGGAQVEHLADFIEVRHRALLWNRGEPAPAKLKT